MTAPLSVAGKTVAEVEEAVRKHYTVDKQLLQPGNDRILVTLLQPRQVSVVVLRQEANGFNPAPEGLVLTGKRGTELSIDLPAGENDVLHALSVTGGLPGLDAFDEVIIQRAIASRTKTAARFFGNSSKRSRDDSPPQTAASAYRCPAAGPKATLRTGRRGAARRRRRALAGPRVRGLLHGRPLAVQRARFAARPRSRRD